MKKLSKEEMKKVVGGVAPPDEGCSVKCASGYYACCYRNLAVAYCPCVENGHVPPSKCDAGGVGSTECSVEHL